MKYWLLPILLIFLLPFGLAAQSDSLSLHDCIGKAQENSPGSRIRRGSYESAYWDFRAWQAGLKPRIVLQGQLPNFDRSIASNLNDDGTVSFVSRNQDYSSLDFSLSQVIVPTGGRVTLRSGLGRIQLFGSTGAVSWNTTPLVATFSQPLFNYNSYRWDKKLQPLGFRIAEARYLEGLEDLAVDITGKFFDVYIAAIQLENANFNVQVNDTVFKISQGRFNVGKIAENDLLSTELALMNARTQARNSQLNFQESLEDLKIALGIPLEEEIAIIPPTHINQVEVNVGFALDQAMQNRSDVLDYENRMLQAESEYARVKNGNRFSANLNASYGLNQSGSTLSQAYNSPLDQQSVGIGFEVPIFQWGKAKAEIRSAEISRNQTFEQVSLDRRRLEKEVRYQALRFLLLQEQVALAAQSDTIAHRQFEVATNRYLIGKIGIIDLQNAQNQKDNARSSYIQTLKSYWVAYYNLRRATLFDFERKNSLEIPNKF